jgi:predicted P-loop ATPase
MTEAPHWRPHCILDGKGRPYSILANALVIMRESDDLAGILSFDEMLGLPILKALPGVDDFGKQRPITDTDLTLIQERLQRLGLTTITRNITFQAVEAVALENSFHPVRNWLDGLKRQWDGERRLPHLLVDYFGARRQPLDYLSEVGEMFMIGMVARIYRPGCKNDYMLQLEGPQGSRKSTACSILGGDWYSDCLPDLVAAGKDVSIHIRGKWLIELAEMNALSRASNAAVKAFVSRQVEKFRPVWGKTEDFQPRQCCFIGTANSLSLDDPTGGRRHWPVATGDIDIAMLKQDREQLFAEAVAYYEQGRAWWPTDPDFEQLVIKAEQDARFDTDVWEEQLTRGFLGGVHTDKVTIGECAKQIGYESIKDIGTREQRRISAILIRLGWSRGKRGSNGERYWYKPGSDTD